MLSLGFEGERTRINARDWRWALNGAAVFKGYDPCGKQSSLTSTNANGQPCASGAAVQLQALAKHGTLLNCIVYYYPSNPKKMVESAILLRQFQAALAQYMQMHPQSRLRSVTGPERIDLTRLAADLTREILKKNDVYGPAYQCKAMAIAPVYERPFPAATRGVFKNWVSEFVGLSGSHGHFIVDHVHVPFQRLDLNSPPGPLLLFIFVAVSSGIQADSQLTDCPTCKFPLSG